MNRKAFGILTFGAALIVTGLLIAQQTQPVQRQPAQPGQAQPGVQIRTGQVGQQAQWLVNDHFLASCTAINNQAEIAIAKFAHERSENKDVQEFAQMLIDDHSAFVKKLAKWAPQAASDGFLDEKSAHAQPAGQQPVNVAAPNQPRPAAGQPGVAQTQPAMRQIDAIGLFRELAMECISSGKQALSEKEGKDFDMCFVGSQFLMHSQMQDKLTVFQRHATGELAELFSDASEAVDKHMDHAKALMEKLDGRTGSKSTAEREAKSEKRE